MIISERGESVSIDLIDATGKMFVTCPIVQGGPNPVERALDSSRYFVLRIEHPQTKRVAFIGIGFVDRGEAFDFQSTVADAREKIQLEKNIAANAVDWGPDVDFKMKEGETIDIGVPGGDNGRESPDKSNLLDGGDDGIIGPPPSASSGRRRRRRGGGKKKKSSDGDFSLGDLLGGDATSAKSSTTAPSGGSNGGDDEWTLF